MIKCECKYCKKIFEVNFRSRVRTFCSKSCAASGENSNFWVGDKVGKGQVHVWIKKIKPKPDKCENCRKETLYLDLANRSNEYKREINDWDWLCRKCHITSDGRLDRLINISKNKKLDDKTCLLCSKKYHPHTKESKYCSIVCRNRAINLNKKIRAEEHQYIPDKLLQEVNQV